MCSLGRAKIKLRILYQYFLYRYVLLNRAYFIYPLYIISYQLKLIEMRAKLASLNECAVPFLSRAATTFGRTTMYI